MAELVLIAEDDMEIAGILEAYFVREVSVRRMPATARWPLNSTAHSNLILFWPTLPCRAGTGGSSGWEIQRRGHTPSSMVTDAPTKMSTAFRARIGAERLHRQTVSTPSRSWHGQRRPQTRRRPPNRRRRPVRKSDHDLASLPGKDRQRRRNVSRLSLTLTEFRLLTPSCRERRPRFSPGRELVDAWPSRFRSTDRTIDSHLSKLRKKLDQAGGEGMLASIRGVG